MENIVVRICTCNAQDVLPEYLLSLMVICSGRTDHLPQPFSNTGPARVPSLNSKENSAMRDPGAIG